MKYQEPSVILDLTISIEPTYFQQEQTHRPKVPTVNEAIDLFPEASTDEDLGNFLPGRVQSASTKDSASPVPQ